MLNRIHDFPSAKLLSDQLGGRREGGQYKAHCPAHEDSKSSLSIGEGDLRPVLYCHAGCSFSDITAPLIERGLWPDTDASAAESDITYDYVDEGGELLLQVVRKPGKEFRQRHPDATAKGGWRWRSKGVRVVPFQLPEVLEAVALARPVFVVEGERDSSNLATLGIAATTNAGGAGKWRTEHSAFLVGADVVIIPDNDEPGRKHAEKVAKSVKEAGAVRVRVLVLPELKEKGDVSDWLAGGGTAEALWALVDATPDWRPPAARRVTAEELASAAREMAEAEQAPLAAPCSDWLPAEGFKMQRDGSIFHADGEDAEGNVVWRFFCSPFEIAARTTDETRHGHGFLLRVYDGTNGCWHELAMPSRMLPGDPSAFLGQLLDMGLRVSLKAAKAKMAELLMRSRPTRIARCVDQAGWHGEAFVMPSRVIAPNGHLEVVFQTRAVINDKFRSCGTLEGWQQQVAAPAAGNSRLVLAISAAFAGPCLRPAMQDSGGIHFRGKSSEGKTTALRVAGSVWGGGGPSGFVDNWRHTTNGLEGKARAHSDSLLLLQEMGQAPADVVVDAAYLIANNTGRGRMNSEAQMLKTAEWRVLYLSDGEITLDEKIADMPGNKKRMAGQMVRMIDVEANAGKGLGVFDCLAGSASGGELSTRLRMATETHYGLAAPLFLERLVADLPGTAVFLVERISQFVALHAKDCDGQVERVAKRFGLIAAAGELAIKWGILPWAMTEPETACARCFREWRDARGTDGPIEIRQGVKQVQQFIEREGASRFSSWVAPATPVRDRLGFVRRAETEPHEATYFVLAAGWREICKGFNPAELAQHFAQNGVLDAERDGKTSQSVRLPGLGKTRCYVINAEKLLDDDIAFGVPGVPGVLS